MWGENSMKVVKIGKGMCRIIIRSKTLRQRLSRIPEVTIHENRVIFPERLLYDITFVITPPIKNKQSKKVQTELF